MMALAREVSQLFRYTPHHMRLLFLLGFDRVHEKPIAQRHKWLLQIGHNHHLCLFKIGLS